VGRRILMVPAAFFVVQSVNLGFGGVSKLCTLTIFKAKIKSMFTFKPY